MSSDMREIGNAFIRLGLALQNDRNTGLKEETLSKLLECVPEIISAKSDNAGPPKWSEDKDPLGALILTCITNGDTLPTGTNDTVKNALTRLRRNGLIVNRGTRAKPKWCLTTDDERQTVVGALKLKRLSYQRPSQSKRTYGQHAPKVLS